jgi:hypothetical protein
MRGAPSAAYRRYASEKRQSRRPLLGCPKGPLASGRGLNRVGYTPRNSLINSEAVKAARASTLSLRIECAEQVFERGLAPGQKLVIGRGEDCEIRLVADSVSTRHLELLWTGTELQVKDLRSANGTFRMPQNAPFESAGFTVPEGSLELRLAKQHFLLTWKALDADSPLEKTIALAKDPPVESPSPKSEPKVPDVKVAPTEKPAKKKKRKKKDAKPQLSTFASPSLAREATFFAILLAGLAVGVGAFLVLLPLWSFLFGVPVALLSLGGAQDLGVLYIRHLVFHVSVLGGACVLVLWFSSRLVARAKVWADRPARWMGWLAPLLRLLPRNGAWARLGALVFVTLLSTWPLGVAVVYGARFRHLKPAIRLADLHARLETDDLKDKSSIVARVEELQQAALESPGSSIAYRDWYRLQKRRTLLECDGVGDKEWSAKRFCLILLYGVALEGFTRFRPALLGESAALNVILSSLDGMTRVLAAEGTQSKNVALFLEALELVGLDAERKDLLEFIAGYQGMQLSALLEGLVRLRLRIETRIGRQQASYRKHAELHLDLAGPLELGI